MKATLLFCFFLFCCTCIFGQNKNFVLVKAGNNIMDVLPKEEIFYYSQFTPGKVLQKDGSVAEGKLNYNRLVDEMHFISSKGDTLALDDEQTIRYVTIDVDTFYYDRGFVRLLSANNAAKLAFKQLWIIADSRLLGAYNSTNTTVSLTSFTSYQQGGRLYDLTVNEDLVLKKVEQYHIGDNNNRFVLADKRNLLSLFPGKQKRIEMYLKTNKVNFTKKEDLEKVIQFLGGS